VRALRSVAVHVAGFFEAHSDSIASRAALALSKLGLAMRNRAWAFAGERGLTPTQGQVLVLLRTRGVPLRLGQVAEELAISAPTASDSVRALVDKGLVSKTRARDDARAVALELTSAGRQEAERALSWQDFLLSGIEALAPAEQEAFLALLLKILGALVERGQVPMQRTCLLCRYFRASDSANAVYHCSRLDAPLSRRHLRVDCPDHAPVRDDAVRRPIAAF